MRSLVPIVAAVLALSGALTGMCFVKVYGVAFLGQQPARVRAPAARGEPVGARGHAVAHHRLLRARAPAGVHDRRVEQGQRRVDRHRPPRGGAGFRLAVARAHRRRAGELQPGRLPARHRRGVRARPSSRCASSITAGCAAPTRGTAAFRSRPRACRTPRTLSASRSGRSSRRSTGSAARFRAPTIRGRCSGSRSRTATGRRSTCRSRAAPSSCRGQIGRVQQGRISVYLLYSFLTLIALLVFAQ